MGNVYGVANPVATPAVYGCVGAADVTLTHDSEITFITSGALTAGSPGNYYPLIQGALVVAFGGSAPTALVLAFKLGSGADVQTYTVAPALLANSATIVVPFVFIGANSGSAWVGSGSTVNITANGATNTSTAKNVGCYAYVQLVRGPD